MITSQNYIGIKPSQFENSILKGIESELGLQFSNAQINRGQYDLAVKGLNIVKANINPNLVLTHVIDRNGHHTIRYKRREHSKRENHYPIDSGSSVTLNGKEHKLIGVNEKGMAYLKGDDNKVFERSLRKLKFKHPLTGEEVEFTGDHRPIDYHKDGTENVHGTLRDKVDSRLSNRQIDSVIRQLHEAGVTNEDLAIKVEQVPENLYRKTTGGTVAYGTSGVYRGEPKVLTDIEKRNAEALQNKIGEVKTHLNITKVDHGITPQMTKNILVSLIHRASEGKDIFKDIDVRKNLMRVDPRRRLINTFLKEHGQQYMDAVSMDRYGNLNVTKPVYINQKNLDNGTPYKFGTVESLGVSSDTLTSLKDVSVKNVTGVLTLNTPNLKTFKYFPDKVGGVESRRNTVMKSMDFNEKTVVDGNLLFTNGVLETVGDLPEVRKGISLNNNKLTNLNGLPDKLNGSLDISHNPIKDFTGAPKEIYANLYMYGVKPKSLKGFPSKVGAVFMFDNGDLTRKEINDVSDVKYNTRESDSQIARNLDSKDAEFRKRWFLDYTLR